MGLPLRDRDVIDRGLVAGEIPKKKTARMVRAREIDSTRGPV
ncbi:hypothetical protein [Corynebacterium pseudotuberculosis]|nr:hypothetical protein [Corynebacterium pseudotuberculosis]